MNRSLNQCLVKIHKQSGKISRHKYDDFEGKALPELLERIKVNLRRQVYEFFDHRPTASALLQRALCFQRPF
jgi:hypothetical protein